MNWHDAYRRYRVLQRLFHRRDGTPLNQRFVDAMLRLVTPVRCHSSEMRLALSGVPISVFSS
jgi:hypothetical protein